MSKEKEKVKKKDTVRPVEMFKIMKQKVFQLLQAEGKMNMTERSCQQWQLLFTIPGKGQVIVGKGGINTMFYIINEGERKLCLPSDMLDKIDKWIAKASVVTYKIRHEGKTLYDNLSTIKEAKALKVPKGSALYEVKNGGKKKLAVYEKALFGVAWNDIKKGK